LSPVEFNYTVIENEFLAVVHAIYKFRHCIIVYETFVHMDHSVTRYVINKLITNGKITRFLLLFQEFNITILDRHGKQNKNPDFLSRIRNHNNDVPIEDNFLDEYIFMVSINSPWFADIANYLATGKLPLYLSPREKRKVIEIITYYSWINGELYKIGPDEIIQRCVREDEVSKILKACQDELCGGHFTDERIAYKILLIRYYWPSLFKDAKEYVKRCDSCIRMGKLSSSYEIPLQP